MSLGRRIKRRRTELKLSQKALAQALGVTQGAVAQMELGLRSPSLELLPRLAGALRVSMEYLLRGETAATVDVSSLNAGDRRLVRRFAAFLEREAEER